MSIPPTTYQDANSEMLRQGTDDAISQISNPHACNLLGAIREMPGLTDDEASLSMMPYPKELEIVKEKFRCSQHWDENEWCWVEPNAPNDHIPLALQDIQLWAKSLVS